MDRKKWVFIIVVWHVVQLEHDEMGTRVRNLYYAAGKSLSMISLRNGVGEARGKTKDLAGPHVSCPATQTSLH